jgi:hypothetical protein
MWLLTDLLGTGSPQYVGSYLFTATYTSYAVSNVENLPYYPALTFDANHVPISLVFEVIDPADLFAATPGDDHVGPGQVWAYADFMQDGNLFIEGGQVTFSGAFVLDQDFDYQKAVVLRSGKLTLTQTSSFTSNHRFNLYLYNSSELDVDGGFLSLNALVTFGSSVVTIDNGSTYQGSFILQGSSFTMGTGVRASGIQLYARGATSIQLLGAEIQVSRVDVVTNGDITINNTILSSSGNLVLRTNEAAGKALRIANSVLSGQDLQLEGATMDIASTQFLTNTVSRFWANSIVARQSGFSARLTGFKPGSGSVFYDVTYPTLQVDPGAIVSTFHRLSLVVVDVNNNIVTSGTYEIKLVPDGTSAGSGELAPIVEKDLASSTIVQGVETFFGNYEVSVTATGVSTPVVRSAVMNVQQNLVVTFPQELVLPTAVVIAATVEPSSILPGETLFVNGTVLLSYAGRGGLTPPTSSVTVDITSGTIVSAQVTTNPDGTFSWSGAYTVPDSRSGIQTITAATSYRGVTGSTELAFELRPAPPTGLIINLENSRFEKRTSEQFVVAGTVLYNNGKPAENIAVTVVFTIPASGEAYTGRTDANGIFSVTIPGRRTAATYSLNVRAEDPDNGLIQVSQPITVVVSAGQIGTSNTGLFSGTTLLIVGLIGAGIVVGFIALLVNAKRKSANYVECGNCGRPAREGDRKCPSCGVEFEEDIAKCSHCASWIPANASRCPKCNTEFKPIDETITSKAEAAAAEAPVEDARAEVTTPSAPVKAPVAVKKKVMKTAETASAEGPKYENPWDQPGAAPTQPIQPGEDKPAQAPPKKPEEKKEKGLFDDL